MKVRLTVPAERDVARILEHSRRAFGPLQAKRYADIIETGLGLIAEDPSRPSSKARDELQKGIRSFHLQLATRRRGGASHILYFRLRSLPDGTPELIVVRVLGDEMEPLRRIRVSGAAENETSD